VDKENTMGMFDYIRVETSLPGFAGDLTTTNFQTKDLDNALDTYVITKNGQLYKEEWEYKWIDDDNMFLKGYWGKIPDSYRRLYLTDYHGDIRFYDSEYIDKEARVWREYYARFTEGKLTKMWFKDEQY
jgi:hypothetical protein